MCLFYICFSFLFLFCFSFFVFVSLVFNDCFHFWVPWFVCSLVFCFCFCFSFSVCFFVSVCLVLFSSFVLGFGLSVCFLSSFFLCVCCCWCLIVFLFAVCLGFCLFVWFLCLFFSFLFLWPCCMACGFLVPQPGVGPGPTGWELRVQDSGPPENSWPQGILIGMHSPEGIHINKKTRHHPTACRFQWWTPHDRQPARKEQAHSSADRLPKVLLSNFSHRHPQIHPLTWPCPSEGKGSALPTRVQAPVPPTRKPTQAPEPTSPTRGQTTETRRTMTLQPAERNHKYSKLDKVRQQRNMLQMKEQGKNPQD